jgi:transposase
MEKLHLSGHQLRRIQKKLSRSTDSRRYRRLSAILWLNEGRGVTEVSSLSGVSRQAVYDWIDGWKREPHSFLESKIERSGRPSIWNSEIEKCLVKALEKYPHDFGHLTPNWTIPLLRRHLSEKTGVQVSDPTLRRQLRRLEYVWKRPRYRLIKDDEVSKKSDASENTYVDCLSGQ